MGGVVGGVGEGSGVEVGVVVEGGVGEGSVGDTVDGTIKINRLCQNDIWYRKRITRVYCTHIRVP